MNKQHFEDKFGHLWKIDLTVGLLRDVKRKTGVDLLAALDDASSLRKLSDDIETLVNVIWLLVEDQAEAFPGDKPLTDEEFGRRLNGQSVDDATRALLEALVDFFPQSRRPILQKIIEKALAIETATLAKVESMIDAGAIEKAMEIPGA